MEIEYVRNKKSRCLRIIVHKDGRIKVTRPYWVSLEKAQAFVEEKRDWIKSQIDNLSRYPIARKQESISEYLRLREKTRQLVRDRLQYFNLFYKYNFNRVAIRRCRTRWGSCSAGKNLNFNYKLLFLTPEQSDYVIVHELCHLKEMNHSPAFWSLVAQTVPDYRDLSRSLRKIVP